MNILSKISLRVNERQIFKLSPLFGLWRLNVFNIIHAEATQRMIYILGCHGDY